MREKGKVKMKIDQRLPFFKHYKLIENRDDSFIVSDCDGKQKVIPAAIYYHLLLLSPYQEVNDCLPVDLCSSGFSLLYLMLRRGSERVAIFISTGGKKFFIHSEVDQYNYQFFELFLPVIPTPLLVQLHQYLDLQLLFNRAVKVNVHPIMLIQLQQLADFTSSSNKVIDYLDDKEAFFSFCCRNDPTCQTSLARRIWKTIEQKSNVVTLPTMHVRVLDVKRATFLQLPSLEEVQLFLNKQEELEKKGIDDYLFSFSSRYI